MPWHYEVRMEQFVHDHQPLPRSYLTNGIDTDIMCAGAMFPVFFYKRHDLSFKMSANRNLRDVPRADFPKSDCSMQLGPKCSLFLDMKSLSRELTQDDYPRIAADFKAALELYLEIPGAEPPRVECVTFYNEFLAPFND